jgi:carbon storage regulator
MLVLSRKTGERIQIGTEIEISVVRVKGDRVQIGIQAPRDVIVRREELVVRPAAEPCLAGMSSECEST